MILNCRSITTSGRGFNGQCCCKLSEAAVKNAGVTQLCVPWGTDIVVGYLTGVVDEQ